MDADNFSTQKDPDKEWITGTQQKNGDSIK